MINLWHNLKGMHFKNLHSVSEWSYRSFSNTVPIYSEKPWTHIDCRYLTYISLMECVSYRFNKENYFWIMLCLECICFGNRLTMNIKSNYCSPSSSSWDISLWNQQIGSAIVRAASISKKYRKKIKRTEDPSECGSPQRVPDIPVLSTTDSCGLFKLLLAEAPYCFFRCWRVRSTKTKRPRPAG